jgi:hypothetical protein
MHSWGNFGTACTAVEFTFGAPYLIVSYITISSLRTRTPNPAQRHAKRLFASVPLISRCSHTHVSKFSIEGQIVVPQRNIPINTHGMICRHAIDFNLTMVACCNEMYGWLGRGVIATRPMDSPHRRNLGYSAASK